MHVEVNEQNIAIYELDRLTGNSKEVLLANAAEALESGYTLYCQIPDPDEPIHINAFEHYDSEPAPKVRGDDFEVHTGEGTVIRFDQDGAQIVRGEVLNEEDDR